ncbi:MAG: 50S ribosomal protein L29 [Gemmatimonadetes bacterium]|nr:MAG: 50S ribosomal protein L29 [Gemmatimonadota bacterium]
MRADDLREYTVSELEDHIHDLEENLFSLRMQHGTGQLDNTAKLAQVRKDLARAKTVLREHQLGIRTLAGHN